MRFTVFRRTFSSAGSTRLKLSNRDFVKDDFTNVPEKIMRLLDRKIYLQEGHPLSLMRQRIVNYFYENFKSRTGNSYFSVHDRFEPIVSTYDNFDSLLVPQDHVTRRKSDCYYINKDFVLRSHMTAHQSELLKAGLNTFLMVGDVYRRDEIDRTHYPAFHQLDGVHLFTAQQLFSKEDDGTKELSIMRKDIKERSKECQEFYTDEASKKVELHLKKSLEGLCKDLFGSEIVYRWCDTYFPFTHPSWELEILLNENWCEVLGCGVMEYKILTEAGCENRIGWAFGLGLERLTMISYEIPDIRIFWSTDTGFLNQFAGKSFSEKIKYKPISVYPQCKNHISFWIPDKFSPNDFYDLVREVGGDYVEQVHLIDVYDSKKMGKTSHCYEIIYRHPEKTFTQKETNTIHEKIAEMASSKLNVIVR